MDTKLTTLVQKVWTQTLPLLQLHDERFQSPRGCFFGPSDSPKTIQQGSRFQTNVLLSNLHEEVAFQREIRRDKATQQREGPLGEELVLFRGQVVPAETQVHRRCQVQTERVEEVRRFLHSNIMYILLVNIWCKSD